MQGKYFIIEGPDFSGKTTQVNQVRSILNNTGYDVYSELIREPGGTKPGEFIRKFLLDDEYKEFQSEKSQVLGFNYDRAMLVETVLIPAVKSGKIIVSDRSWLSTIAYQCFAGKMPLEETLTICEFVMRDCMPTHIFLLDVSLEESIRRMESRSGEVNHYDSKDRTFKQKIREGYTWITGRYKDILTVIDGEQDQNKISQEIVDHIQQIIS